ncbi:MAG: hypothetical protein COU10_00130 [Candidatus Harrisonbacteria bacterium CG10_big_fil_rev_8_21_14_0_10_45_28]|uniref:LTD domain-containing protein n=1 Tax=Candidatus Harrisonbacteria bacterium CG10_big_fil_rev_8_21_14_0_10_45_28 TaxID=1974586 RepID=A0A2H0UPC1_9BACT|nr:MAG: hypothetical protein COU10_00130 [Candidatus Harrisonbacteria bacterium CG10_big_fil_rev_8_21_14_0_10_45_28]
MIRISEVLPNPVGADKGGEYIILVNDGSESQSLAGWKIKDKSGKEFSLSGYVIEAGEGLKFSDLTSKLVLNNSEEVVELLNPAGEVVDSLSYSGQAQEGFAILQNAQISDELRAQIFEDLSGEGQTVQEYASRQSFGGLMGLVFVVGIVLALIAVIVLKKSK